jgi:AcrR family transcriptional regulator
MSAIAREAGVAVGTTYLYFESKEALINALYTELIDDRERALAVDEEPGLPTLEQLWRVWSSYARWHLEEREASNFIQQCEASGILSEETLARERDRRAKGLVSFEEAVRQGVLRDLPIQVFYAHFAGPFFVLAQVQEKQEIEITDEILRQTFEGVARAVGAPGRGLWHG